MNIEMQKVLDKIDELIKKEKEHQTHFRKNIKRRI